MESCVIKGKIFPVNPNPDLSDMETAVFVIWQTLLVLLASRVLMETVLVLVESKGGGHTKGTQKICVTEENSRDRLR